MSKHELNKQDKYHQGVYKLQNVDKYIGNPNEVLYRSGWEFKFMLYCDLNPGIIKWGSEVFKIPYNDFMGKGHVYIPDFYLETRNTEHPDLMNRFLVEIKPEKQIREPKIPMTISEKKLKGLEYDIAEWQKNKYKWAYAQEWCKNRDIKFWLVTEEHLNSFKP
jgi:hypothetical protein